LGEQQVKIHGLCIVKNEADVIRESLLSALNWCDHMYIFDNGSDDGTWELVKELAERHLEIVLYKQDDVIYRNGLRADIFNAFRFKADLGDWWCWLDADEFYIDDPRIFLAKIPDRFETVWSASFAYYFTDQDLILYQKDPLSYSKIPVERRLRYYKNHWSEPRFFRHRDGIVWTRDHGWPESLSRAHAYPVRIWLKHYQYRSPEQIERRLLTRRQAIEAGTGFRHEALPNWRAAIGNASVDFESVRPEFAGARWQERVVPAASLSYDGFDRRYVANESLMPRMQIRPRRWRLRGMIPERIRAPLGQFRLQTLTLAERLRPRWER
jgi:glycosyltransferase involved in cell wall biosynthesis